MMTSLKLQMYNIFSMRKMFTPISESRFLLLDGLDSIPFGHYSIRDGVEHETVFEERE